MIHGLHRSCLERGATNILGLLSRTDRKAFKVVGTSMECDFRLPRFTSEAILGLTSNAIELNYIELWANSKKRPLTTKEYKRLTFTTLLRLTISSIFRLTPGLWGLGVLLRTFLVWGGSGQTRKSEKSKSSC